jgi:hypothetical protein
MAVGVGLISGAFIGSKSHSDTGVAVGIGVGLVTFAGLLISRHKHRDKFPWQLSATGAPPPPISSPGATGNWPHQPRSSPGEREASVP